MGYLSVLCEFHEFDYFLPNVLDEGIFIRFSFTDFFQILPADFFAI